MSSKPFLNKAYWTEAYYLNLQERKDHKFLALGIRASKSLM